MLRLRSYEENGRAYCPRVEEVGNVEMALVDVAVAPEAPLEGCSATLMP